MLHLPAHSAARVAVAARSLRVAAVVARHYSNSLDVKIPDVSADPAAHEPQAKVPFVYDFWDSKAKAATPAPPPEAAAESLHLPRVVTAAAAETHLGGGPSSNAYQPPIEPAPPAPHAAAPSPGVFSSIARDIGIPSASDIAHSLAKITDPAAAPPPPKSRPLSDDDKKGLWILLGLVAGGWIAGGVLTPPAPADTEHEH